MIGRKSIKKTLKFGKNKVILHANKNYSIVECLWNQPYQYSTEFFNTYKGRQINSRDVIESMNNFVKERKNG